MKNLKNITRLPFPPRKEEGDLKKLWRKKIADPGQLVTMLPNKKTPNRKCKKKGLASSISFRTPSDWRTLSDDSDQEVCTFAMNGRCTSTLFNDCPCKSSHDVTTIKKLFPCKYYMSRTFCNRETCMYLHEEFPCKFHHLNGNCRDGDNCRYSHERDETTLFLLERVFEEHRRKQEENIVRTTKKSQSETVVTPPVETVSTPTEESSFSAEIAALLEENSSVSPNLPITLSFYTSRDEEEEKDTASSSTPLPSSLEQLLQSNEDEKMEEDDKSSKSSEDELEPDILYPSKTISITLPPLNINSSSSQDDRPTPQINPQMQWKLRKVIRNHKIDYKSIRSSSSPREILMDPRLSKNRCL